MILCDPYSQVTKGKTGQRQEPPTSPCYFYQRATPNPSLNKMLQGAISMVTPTPDRPAWGKVVAQREGIGPRALELSRRLPWYPQDSQFSSS